MLPRRSRRDSFGDEEMRSLAGLAAGKPDATRRTAQPCQHRAAQVSLKVHRDRRAPGADLAHHSSGRRNRAALPFEREHPVDLRMTADDAGVAVLHEPADLSAGTRGPQRRERGQALHDVAQRREADQEDSFIAHAEAESAVTDSVHIRE